MKYYEDPILGKGRAADISGGTGGGGGTSYIAGDGLNLAGQTFSLATAEVQDVLNGTQTVEAVDVSALRGALTAGQAVDVTSQPDNVTGDWKDPFNWTDGYLGFDNSFPKYADGLTYLLIADLTYNRGMGGGYILISPSGTWLDGSTTAIRLNDGETKRVAMLFSSRTGKLTVNEFGVGDDIAVTHLREYEVTACSTEAIAYIASLSNPDAFAAFYLVKSDMVQPWTYIIDMGTSPAVTIASGLSYKLNAATGTHQLTVDTCPAGYDGRDAIIRITLGGSGVIQAVAPLQLGGALVPYAINNCVVRFRDGEAVLLVEDTLAGYVVTLTSGTGEGSLAYGLAKADIPYIAFSTSTDGQTVDMGNAVTANKEVAVVGNGYEETILTGNITCTSKTIVANLALSDVQVVGGTLTLGDAYIPSGSTVAVNGGKLSIEKVTGNEGTIALGGTSVYCSGSIINGVVFLGGTVRLNSGATATSAGISRGTLACSASAYANNTSVYGSGTLYVGDISSGGIVYLDGIAYVNPGGTANDYNVSSGGILAVYSGGTANEPIISSGGSLRVSSGGTASAPVISSGGISYVYNGGTANEPIISSGGSLRVSSGGTALLVTSETGALVTVSAGGYITYKE